VKMSWRKPATEPRLEATKRANSLFLKIFHVSIYS
jgi:hypothetical protein